MRSYTEDFIRKPRTPRSEDRSEKEEEKFFLYTENGHLKRKADILSLIHKLNITETKI